MAAATNSPIPTEGSAKRERVREMFADIAGRYDFVNSLMSLGLHRRWRSWAVRRLALAEGGSALDVCCGTGDFLVPLRRALGHSATVVGLDYCHPMLRLAARKGTQAGLAAADACAIPFATGSFDAVTVGWGLRNLADMDTGLREIARVLKPGGRIVCLDMSVPKQPIVRSASRFVCGQMLPLVGGLLGKREAYKYLAVSTEAFSSREELAAAFEKAGFVDVGWKDLMLGNVCMHWGRKA
jgi:demethylmenaquinone methyltransferase/2-methoxy-6-polyprenyl-1,4-benzoquinol methylase